MERRTARQVLGSAFVLAIWLGVPARGQGPTIPEGRTLEPGSTASSLGPMPGSGASPFGGAPGTSAAETAGSLGGPPGTTFPRVPVSILTPPRQGAAPRPGVLTPPHLSITDVPLYGPLAVPEAAEEEGPPEGLTLDAAIDRLLRDNLTLRAESWQIPQARADVLTAGLRANPVLFADAQLVPYGRYGRDRPGGQVQYDVNIAHPIDYSAKRLARIDAAEHEVAVVEAQFRDAVRIQIDNLYTAFVNVIAARETVRYAKASVVGLEQVVKTNEGLFERADATRADVDRVRSLRVAAGLGVEQAEETLRQTRRTLATLLDIGPAEEAALRVRGTLADVAPPPPSADLLVRIALDSRPDLAAVRLAIARSRAEVHLERANRFSDAFLLYQPYTFQDNTPNGLKSATSWALGVTVPIPLYDRNQGRIARARLNVDQTKTELAALERQVANEVRNAERAYAVTKGMVQRYETDLLPSSVQQRDVAMRLFVAGEETALDAYNARRDHNEVVRQYRDTLIRHRRNMLALNTVLGRRVLP